MPLHFSVVSKVHATCEEYISRSMKGKGAFLQGNEAIDSGGGGEGRFKVLV